ncbi:uncharacterized protein METZ01_LOCUS485672, partial [marine metagenome]
SSLRSCGCANCSTISDWTHGRVHGRRTTTSTITNWKCCHCLNRSLPSLQNSL